MPAKLRLQRHGKKGYAFYHIVVADSRAPRDGKFIENIGIYNPNTNPATIEINFDKAAIWLVIVPDGQKIADSIPNISAAKVSSSLMEGSSPKTSSPTLALNIASSMPDVGFVTVSDLKSIIIFKVFCKILIPVLSQWK